MKPFHIAAGLAACLLAGAVHAATYDIEVLIKNQGEATSSVDELSINNDGTVAYEDYYRPGNVGSASDNRFRIAEFDNDGNLSYSFDVQCPVCASLYYSPIINDAGQVLVYTTSDVSGGNPELAILEPDGTKTVLAENVLNGTGDRADVPNYSTLPTTQLTINDNGDVAALVRTTDGATQIVKFPSGGGDPVVIYDSTTSEIFSVRGLDINDAGEVAFIGTVQGNPDPNRTSTVSVYVADGTTTTPVVTQADYRFLGWPTINENGDVAIGITSSNGVEAGYLVQEVGATDPDVTYVGSSNTLGGSVQSINLNDYGQVAYKYANDVYVDGQLVLEAGQSIDGLNSNVGTSGNDVDLRQHVALNNSGQIVVGVGLDGYAPDGEDTSAVLRINQAGATYGNAITPFDSTADGQNSLLVEINNALGVEQFIYLDPIVATGFVYTQDAGSPGFAELLIPTDIPLLQNSFTLEFAYGAGQFYSGTIAKGDIFNFLNYDAAGVMSFTLKGIDVAEAVDPTDPFIVGIKFASGGFTSVVSIDAITVDTDGVGGQVPLPAGLPLLIAGLGALAVIRRKSV